MIAVGCFVVLFAVLGTHAQSHGGQGHSPLHSICHSNHQQMNEDQVIETVVPLMDRNSDGNVSRPELVQFFADLSGKQLQVDAQTLHAMTDDELLQLIGNLNITKHDFTQAWHSRFHDSIDFVGATFDALEGLSGDTNGILSAAEIEGIVNDALANFDANNDGTLQNAEMVAYLERIYKNCP